MNKIRSAEELRKIELSFAYELASGAIDSECLPAPIEDQWHNLASAKVDLSDAVDYLASRGLIEVHPKNPNWIRICDESEPTPVPPSDPAATFDFLEPLKAFNAIYEGFISQNEHPLIAASIQCPRCKRVSFHPKDVRTGYCGFCHEFTTKR